MDTSLQEILRSPEKFSAQPFWQDKNTPIFIYGTGSVGQDIYQILSQKGIAVHGFMDHRPHENPFINDIRIYQPNDETTSLKPEKAL